MASVVSAPTPTSSYPRGQPMPLARGAISRAILAFLPRRTLIPLIRDNLAAFAGDDAGASVGDVLETMRGVRRDGHAVAHGEVTPGVLGIAVPIFERGRAPVAALGLTSDETSMTPLRLSSIASDLHAAADRLTGRLAAGEDETAASATAPDRSQRLSAQLTRTSCSRSMPSITSGRSRSSRP